MFLNVLSQSSSFWQIIIAAGITGATVSASFTLLGNRWLKEIDYRYDYKKYVLRKRIEAYEKFQNFIIRCRKGVMIRDKFPDYLDKPVHAMFYSETNDANPLKPFTTEIQDLKFENYVWLSVSMIALLEKFHVAIQNIYDDWKSDLPVTNIKLIERGTNAYYKIEKGILQLQQQYLIDLKNLDNIRNFNKKNSLLKRFVAKLREEDFMK
jgi:hypothetical protein